MIHMVPNISICHEAFQVYLKPSFTLETFLTSSTLGHSPDPQFHLVMEVSCLPYPVPALPSPLLTPPNHCCHSVRR